MQWPQPGYPQQIKSLPPDPTQPDPSAASVIEDWSGLGDLVTLTIERLADPVEGMHRAISGRWFRLAGPAANPVHRAYWSMTAGVYGSVRLAGAAMGSVMAHGAEAAQHRGPVPRLWRSPLGSGIQAVANAVWGDQLDKQASSLAIEMGLRDHEGDLVDPNPVPLAQSFHTPTPRLALLIHGLGETERCWKPEPSDEDMSAGLADELVAEGFTPLLLRYNTGRSLSENGSLLASLLERILNGWPVAVEEIALVGNSMGGLVARSSIEAGRSAGHAWPALVRRLVTLGAPHLGAPLASAADLASRALRIAPASRPLSDFLDHRSAGVKDLQTGAISAPMHYDSDDESVSREPDGVEQHFVAAVVTENVNHPVGALLGDLVVRAQSATGRGRRRQVEASHVRVVGGRRHFDLARDPVVVEQVRQWLAAGPD